MGYRNDRNFKFAALLTAGLLLIAPGLAVADARDVPGQRDLVLCTSILNGYERRKPAAVCIAGWSTRYSTSIKEDTGVDLEKELDRLTAYLARRSGPRVPIRGPISQVSKDRLDDPDCR